jgi:hypothetical protein
MKTNTPSKKHQETYLKEKRPNANQGHQCFYTKHKRNIWKIAAIVAVLIFILVLAGNLIKMYRFNSNFIPTTDIQKTTAQELITKDLQSRGADPTQYNIVASPKIMSMQTRGTQRNILQAFAKDNTSRHMYLIDIDQNIIVMHSQMEKYDWMAQEKGLEGGRGFAPIGPGSHDSRPKNIEMPAPLQDWILGDRIRGR